MRRRISGLVSLVVLASCADPEPMREPCTSDGVSGYLPAVGNISLSVDETRHLMLERELQVHDSDEFFSIHGCGLDDGDQFFLVASWEGGGDMDFNFTESGGPRITGRAYRCEGGETCLLMQPDWLFRRERTAIGVEPDRVDGTVFLSERSLGRAHGFFTVQQFGHVTDVEFDLEWEVGDEM